MSEQANTPADCRRCVWFRSAPFEAKHEGCYLPENMPSKQSASYLDEQQVPGNHRTINRRGDCPDFQARATKLPFWKRLFSVGA